MSTKFILTLFVYYFWPYHFHKPLSKNKEIAVITYMNLYNYQKVFSSILMTIEIDSSTSKYTILDERPRCIINNLKIKEDYLSWFTSLGFKVVWIVYSNPYLN